MVRLAIFGDQNPMLKVVKNAKLNSNLVYENEQLARQIYNADTFAGGGMRKVVTKNKDR